ncbi:acyl carrier protein-like protein [Filobasidium floriforme]|uniref:acyl carrier protein-like protein n=1 Tax=Filobasidium floriforme TaxID=5210 RepID=UPI001E8C9F16|nr:acyl carrier protein-like protein [Filobasidium floriforme]KAH8087943.1 acyl carrier protein-like protein [Filobasidium floriforme]
MLRAILPTLRTALPRPVVARAIALPARPQAIRFYAASSGLNKEDITKRVMDVLKEFEKVDGVKLSPTSSFTKDLGLDSLDAVEVVMAIEEEFAIEIPDEDADAITSVGQAIEYIAKTPEAH